MAQKGFLRGTITDAETGETLIGATVLKQGTSIGAVADFDGNYSLALDAGTHNIVFQFVGYQTKVVENVTIVADEVTKIDIALGTDSQALEELVITAELVKDSEAAVLSLQRKSANVLDGVSAQTFKKTGDSNLSQAIKRVTGVSVQGGKYVYVRGLGDRYTKTLLNGLSIPGLDPERNDVQIDLFPTNVLENVLIFKTFSPDLPGDFTGGVVNIETRSFPDEKTTTASLSLSYRPNMHLINNFLTYDGGGMDILGFDNGDREIPFSSDVNIPLVNNDDPQLEALTRSLDPVMGSKRANNLLNASFGFTHGNQIDGEKFNVGYNFVVKYQRNTEYFENARLSSVYFKDADRSITDLDIQAVTQGDLGRINVLWSALGSISVKNDKNQFTLNLFRTQNGLTETGKRVSSDVEETGQTVFEDILTYSQRSVTSASLLGKHNFGKLQLEWGNALSFSRVYDPNFRTSSIVEVPIDGTDDVFYSIRPGQGGFVGIFWRDLNEINENLRADLTYNVAEKNKLKVGAQGLLKWRDFETFNYNLGSTLNEIPNDPNQLLSPGNIWTPGGQGNYIIGNFEPANSFEARSSVYAGYAMHDITLNKFRAIYGLRVEKADIFYTGQDQQGNIVLDDENILDELDLLPAVNLVYSFTEKINLRGSYGRTLARPSFVEKSISQVLDPITGITINGNPDLGQTSIDNFDIRLENFFGAPGEMISISGFYKRFDGHIERTRFETEPTQITFRNIGGSTVYGVELEFRKNLDFLVSGVSVGSNISIQRSEVQLDEVFIDAARTRTELESRQDQARTDETIESTRDMAGQSPFLINAFINYADDDLIHNFNLTYNVQGENLAVVGIGQVPDVYTRPFNSLNFNASRVIGANRQGKITLKISNILNDEVEDFYQSFGDAEETFSLFQVGRTYQLGFAYTF
ncbi:MAG: TonB-dependent receptor domain-containing protein [Flammeovirgaceae bacterium]